VPTIAPLDIPKDDASLVAVRSRQSYRAIAKASSRR
jgi:hypothetical protein